MISWIEILFLNKVEEYYFKGLTIVESIKKAAGEISMERKRELLHKAIDMNGLDYEKIIDIDQELHQEIIKEQRKIMKGAKNV